MAELEAAQETLSPEGEVRGLLRIAAPLSFGITQLASVFAELAPSSLAASGHVLQ